MLRLIDPNASHVVKILDTDFHLRSMSIREKFALLDELNKLELSISSFDALVDKLANIITAIDDNANVKDMLNRLENFSDLTTILTEIIAYCSLGVGDAKNSSSSSDTSTPEPAGD